MNFITDYYNYIRGNLRDVLYKYINMGHTQSVITTAQLFAQAQQLKKTTLLTHPDFLKSLELLNEICDEMADHRGRKMIFCVKKGTDESLLWKALVRIKCFTVSSTTGTIQSTHLVNLKQFVHLYDEITKYLHLKANKDEDYEEEEEDDDDNEEECIICMNAKPQIILACSHAYCEPCIEQWQKIQRDCPVCRSVVKGGDEGWVLGEAPGLAEVEAYGMDYIMALVNKCPLVDDDDDDDDDDADDDGSLDPVLALMGQYDSDSE